MPHIESAITTQRITCLKKFSEEYFSPWKHILSLYLKDYGGIFILKCNFRPADLSFDNIPKFYRDCLTAWSTINNKVISHRKKIHLPIW